MSQNNTSILSILPADFEGQIKAGRLYMYLYNELFNLYVCRKTVEIKPLKEDFEQNFPGFQYLHKADFHETTDTGEEESTRSYIMQLEDKLLVEVKTHETAVYANKNIDLSLCKEIIARHIRKKLVKSSFNLIVHSQYSDTGLDVEEFEIRKQTISIEDNYNADFMDVNNSISNFLQEDNSNGLVMLHGKQGTGKTTYIRHLVNTINKKFIYMPEYMLNEISNPRFIPFMKDYKNSILIIEDCEDLLKSRDISKESTNALANLLNLGDGLLSDALFVKIICTFNTDLKNIDKAILRKGRLRARYEFGELSVDKVEKLLKKLEISDMPPAPMTLAEIYNLSDGDFSKNGDSGKIGFRM